MSTELVGSLRRLKLLAMFLSDIWHLGHPLTSMVSLQHSAAVLRRVVTLAVLTSMVSLQHSAAVLWRVVTLAVLTSMVSSQHSVAVLQGVVTLACVDICLQ